VVGVGQQQRGNMGDPPNRVVLICGKCKERTVLGGPEVVWRSGYTVFECGCGEKLTLADRLEEKTAELPTVPRARRLSARR
jgi:hypothetical protein